MINSNVTTSQIELENQQYLTKVFGWMFTGLLITAFVSYYVSINMTSINPILFFIAVGLEFFLVYRIVRYVMSMSVNMATASFIFYSALNGFTLSGLFQMYTSESLTTTFLITSSIFGFMAFYGYTTKKDLTGMGNFMYMGLFGIIIASIVNIFLKSSMMYFLTSIIGVIVFTGLTAYDVQKILKMNIIGNAGTEEDTKESILGALILYLDFINLFIHLIRLIGTRRE
tara:strand:- start:458 stop:1141 length:684 start_codon:yes stop_codon:yes gene_type:complete